MKEKSAKGVKGFLLYSPFDKGHFFRVYSKKNPKKFKDYRITAEEVEIKLISDFNSLVEFKTGDKVLDFSSKALGRKHRERL